MKYMFTSQVDSSIWQLCWIVIKGVCTVLTAKRNTEPRIAMMTFSLSHNPPSRYRDSLQTPFFTVNTHTHTPQRNPFLFGATTNNTCAGNPDSIQPAATITAVVNIGDNKHTHKKRPFSQFTTERKLKISSLLHH